MTTGGAFGSPLMLGGGSTATATPTAAPPDFAYKPGLGPMVRSPGGGSASTVTQSDFEEAWKRRGGHVNPVAVDDQLANRQRYEDALAARKYASNVRAAGKAEARDIRLGQATPDVVSRAELARRPDLQAEMYKNYAASAAAQGASDPATMAWSAGMVSLTGALSTATTPEQISAITAMINRHMADKPDPSRVPVPPPPGLSPAIAPVIPRTASLPPSAGTPVRPSAPSARSPTTRRRRPSAVRGAFSKPWTTNWPAPDFNWNPWYGMTQLGEAFGDWARSP